MNPTSHFEQESIPRSPEAEAVVAKFKGLADMAANWPAEHGAPDRGETTGGVSLADVETFIQETNPSNEVADTQVRAARLFNRIALETRGAPAPDDLSLMDEASPTAILSPFAVIGYSMVHAASHMDRSNRAETAELNGMIDDAVETYLTNLNPTGTIDIMQTQNLKDDLQRKVRDSEHPAVKYPSLPEY